MVETTDTTGYWPGLYEPFRNIGRRVADWFAPSSDASSMDDCYEINVELPGVKSEDIELSLNNNRLIVRGEKQTEREDEGRNYYFSEREYGAFQRTFRLPQDADSENIEANYTDGVLKLKIAKHAVEKPEEKRIPIKSL